jgi:hypothetical protein
MASRARWRAPARGRQGRRSVAEARAGARRVRGQAGVQAREQMAGGRRGRTDAGARGHTSARG